MIFSRLTGAASMLALATAIASTASAASVADFYKGKQVRLLISSSAGGGYDTYGRTTARYLSKHIPGKPNIVVQNMPGARGVVMLNYMYSKANKNGTFLGLVQRGAPFESIIMENKLAKFDPLKLNWLGSLNQSISVLLSWKAAPFKSVDELFDPSNRLVVGSARGDAELFAVALNNVIGTKVNIISSYPGNAEAKLAMIRGEVGGMAAISYSSLMAQQPTWLKTGTVRALVQFGANKHPAIDPKVPLIQDLAKTKADRDALNAIFIRQKMGRPVLTTPGVPADRLKALKDALEATIKDKKFLKGAAKRKLEVNFVTGDEIQQIFNNVGKLPASTRARARAALSSRTFVTDIKLKKFNTAGWSLQKKGKRQLIAFKDASGKLVTLRIHNRRSKGTIAGKKMKGKKLLAALKERADKACSISYVGDGGNVVKIACK